MIYSSLPPIGAPQQWEQKHISSWSLEVLFFHLYYVFPSCLKLHKEAFKKHWRNIHPMMCSPTFSLVISITFWALLSCSINMRHSSFYHGLGLCPQVFLICGMFLSLWSSYWFQMTWPKFCCASSILSRVLLLNWVWYYSYHHRWLTRWYTEEFVVCTKLISPGSSRQRSLSVEFCCQNVDWGTSLSKSKFIIT